MADKNNKKKDELADINQVDVEPLTDADLDTVAGGTYSERTTNNATICESPSSAANACC